jgi:hypothetical protein
MVAYDDVAHSIVDAAERLDNTVIAQRELSVGWGIHPYRTVDDTVLSPVLIEWSQHTDKPPGTRLNLVHYHSVNQSLQPRIAFQVLPDAFVVHFLIYFCKNTKILA